MPPKPDYRDDKTLSLRAKGLYAILLKAKVDGQLHLATRDIAKLTNDNESIVKQGKQDLERHGYLKKQPNNESITIDGETYTLPNL